MEIGLFIGRLVVTALLYVFLLAVLGVLWRDIRLAPPGPAPNLERAGKLMVIEGADQVLPGVTWPLQPFTTLGRGPSNTIILPDTYTSAEHAIIALRGGQWWLEDRDSRNGTTLNGVPIQVPVVISSEDVIGIGRIKLKIEH